MDLAKTDKHLRNDLNSTASPRKRLKLSRTTSKPIDENQNPLNVNKTMNCGSNFNMSTMNTNTATMDRQQEDDQQLNSVQSMGKQVKTSVDCFNESISTNLSTTKTITTTNPNILSDCSDNSNNVALISMSSSSSSNNKINNFDNLDVSVTIVGSCTMEANGAAPIISNDLYGIPTINTPADLRPIVNTSLMKLAYQNQYHHQQTGQQNQQQQHNGSSHNRTISNDRRSPLAIVKSNKMESISCQTNGGDPLNYRKYQTQFGRINNDSFNMFQNRNNNENYSTEDYFARLSDEMVLSIFKWLPKKALMRCCLVNKRFNDVAQDETLWGRLDMAGKNLSSGKLGRIICRGVMVLRLAQSKITDPVYDFSIENNGINHCKLQYLDLSMAIISKSSLLEILSSCRYLKKLSLEHVPVDLDICNEISLNPKIETLNLATCEGINGLCIRKIMTQLKGLKSLNISWTSLNTDCVKTFVECAPATLMRLNIAGCRKSMSDNYLSQLVQCCPELVELDLSDSIILTSEAIKIVKNLSKLEYLSLSRCYNIPVASYLAINELISLAYLDIFGVLSEQSVTMLQLSFPSVGINKFIHSSVARPTVGSRRTSIWGLRTRD